MACGGPLATCCVILELGGAGTPSPSEPVSDGSPRLASGIAACGSCRVVREPLTSTGGRTILSTSEKIQAAKVGEVITLNGQSFLPNENTSASVEFQGVNRRITVEAPNENISKNSRSLTVEVPVGVQSGYINVIINNQSSNSLPLEIIPTIEAIYPNPIIPEARITITAKGAGDNPHLARIIFNKGQAD